MDGSEWDARYARRGQSRNTPPNRTLAIEARRLIPGTALDVGCGEGADAVWLAARGWTVTALDVSQVALARALRTAQERSLAITWVCSALADFEPPATGFDLVTLHYPTLPKTPDDADLRVLLSAVAPGGVLLVVGHARIDVEQARRAGIDPADYVQPSDVAAHLAAQQRAEWVVEVDEEQPRPDPPPGVPLAYDHVVRARRRPPVAG